MEGQKKKKKKSFNKEDSDQDHHPRKTREKRSPCPQIQGEVKALENRVNII